ncbi:uncharacterized protein TNIN_70721 [Trichonephila inaurata madagascariensis]|uniref:Uncharacterized protein n=1 Tax=Trichonephila inaurata madagascariensis TaxID=2747483 RepID=A0A8X6IH36_9ARAC|nr:uncharacterized protein TNIN_70721 [Trichonephila inaurata madagascariensis]
MPETMEDSESETDNILEVVSSLQNVVSNYQTQCNDTLQLNRKLQQDCANLISQFHFQFLNNRSLSNIDSSEINQSETFESKQQHLIDLIQAATKENFQLRESNVKLQRQSKLQDNKIRNLKYMMSQQNKKMVQDKADQRAIRAQENIIRSKLLEIQKLKHEVKKNEQLLTNNNKTIKRVEKRPKTAVVVRGISTTRNNHLEKQNKNATGDNSMISVASKLNDLLDDLNIQISEDKKKGKSCSAYDTFLTETQTSLTKLVTALTVQ